MKTLDKKDKELISTLKSILQKKFGSLILSIHCYGSRITHGNTDSDFDILILTDKSLNWKEKRLVKNEVYDFGIDNDLVFDPKILSIGEFEDTYSFMPFVKSVKSTGIAI